MHIHTHNPSPAVERAPTTVEPKPSRQTAGATISWARLYDALVKVVLLGDERRLRASTVSLAAPKPGERVLEIGCGTGSLAIAAASAGSDVKVYGTDASPEMIRRARQKAARSGVRVDFQEGLAEQIDFPDGSFDVVMCSFVFHHLPGDLKGRAMAEMHRVLRPGGRVLVVDFEPPENRLLRTALTVLLGRGMLRIDNRYLPDLLARSGFDSVEVGRTAHPLATFGRARKVAEHDGAPVR